MLRKIRIVFAIVFFALTALLFLDFTGAVHARFGWLAKAQFVPAVLAANLAIVAGLALLTLVLGRIYCSVACPLGVFQDVVSNIAGSVKRRKARFRFSPAKSWLRLGALGLFVVAMAMGASVVVSLLDPYAAFGRMAANFLAPIYRFGNNLLALLAERADSFAFHSTDVWMRGWMTFGVAAISLLVVGMLAWRGGRTYCNAVCPVGTLLGFLSKFSFFKVAFNEAKCAKCKACERGCKASCVDAKAMSVDHSRCVDCFNCVDACKFGAMSYAPAKAGRKKSAESADDGKSAEDANAANTASSADVAEDADAAGKAAPENGSEQGGFSRRNFLALLGAMTLANTVKAQKLHVDGGLAEIVGKKIPNRKTPIVPPGASGAKNMKSRCTACQLCVSACPNNVLRPSGKLATFMQPEMSFERGYCRPECVECSQVCPTRAIAPISTADKSATSIGIAVWIKENCVANRDGVRCDNCERHCPTGAITLVGGDPDSGDSLKTPAIDKSLCIGCGACEYHCPARPFSAIYVEGNARHHSI